MVAVDSSIYCDELVGWEETQSTVQCAIVSGGGAF